MSKVSPAARTTLRAVPKSGPGTTSWLPEAAVLIVAVAVYVPILLLDRVVTTDDTLYAWVGRNIVTGHGISDWQGPHTMFPPGYPFLVGQAFWLLGNLALACRAVVFAAALGTVMLAMVLARRTCGRRAGIAAGAMAALNPGLIGMAYNGGSEIPFVLFCSISMLIAAWTLSGNILAALITGLVLGAAYLIRPEALLFSLVLIVAVLAVGRKKSMIILLFILGLLVCVVPYSAFLHRNLGYWALTGKSKTLVVDNPFVTENPERALYTLGKSSESYKGDDIKSAERAAKSFMSPVNYLRNAKRAVGATMHIMSLPALLLAAWALFLAVRRRELPGSMIPSLMPLPVLAAMPLFFIRERYLAPVIPMVLLWAAWGASLGLAGRRRLPRAGAAILLCASLAAGIHGIASTFHGSRLEDPVEHMIAGKWLSQHSRPGESVMSRKPWVSFYADRPWVITPLAGYRETIEFARLRRVRYVVVDERFTAKLRPRLRFLLNTSRVPEDLRPVYTVDRDCGERKMPRLVVYELLSTRTEESAGGVPANGTLQE